MYVTKERTYRMYHKKQKLIKQASDIEQACSGYMLIMSRGTYVTAIMQEE